MLLCEPLTWTKPLTHLELFFECLCWLTLWNIARNEFRVPYFFFFFLNLLFWQSYITIKNHCLRWRSLKKLIEQYKACRQSQSSPHQCKKRGIVNCYLHLLKHVSNATGKNVCQKWRNILPSYSRISLNLRIYLSHTSIL